MKHLSWAGVESGISQLLGCDYYTVKFGLEELEDEQALSMSGTRRPGGGRKSAFETIEGCKLILASFQIASAFGDDIL
ncbi:hypothetical protein [Chroococcidiopsis sp. CCMEE 29]|uniref:hypothetical protein n=1 Tax=Chroococcidiopsis sp. CCMEE 29 TaxID=155894 RepID=UPI0020206B60|nr:hypothetical protein [Chroococcidiopsis sp. CCMEE 29]